jgi:hypothetical protein
MSTASVRLASATALSPCLSRAAAWPVQVVGEDRVRRIGHFVGLLVAPQSVPVQPALGLGEGQVVQRPGLPVPGRRRRGPPAPPRRGGPGRAAGRHTRPGHDPPRRTARARATASTQPGPRPSPACPPGHDPAGRPVPWTPRNRAGPDTRPGIPQRPAPARPGTTWCAYGDAHEPATPPDPRRHAAPAGAPRPPRHDPTRNRRTCPPLSQAPATPATGQASRQRVAVARHRTPPNNGRSRGELAAARGEPLPVHRLLNGYLPLGKC